MGDSNTYGLYLDSKDAYPKQLETQWNQSHPERQLEVINIGYPGSNSSRIVANIDSVVETFQPDIILVMIGTNDSWTAPIETIAGTTVYSLPYVSAAVGWLKTHSRVYKLFCILNRPAFEENKLETVTLSDPKQATTAINQPARINYGNQHFEFSMQFRDKNDTSDPFLAMEKNLEKLMQYARHGHTRIIFLTYAANKGYYKQANKITRETVEKNNYPDFIDTTDAFVDLQPPKGEGSELFFADLHATAKGNALFASHIIKKLELLLANK